MTAEEAFGVVLRKYRKKLSVSQEELAFRCDLDRSFVSLLERGIQSPSMRVIMKLADQLGVEASVMMQEVEKLIDTNWDSSNV